MDFTVLIEAQKTSTDKTRGIIMDDMKNIIGCDIEAEMVKDMFGNIVQGYLKKGYNLATEFFRYEGNLI